MSQIMLTRDWKGYRKNRVLTPSDGVSDVLIRRGIATLVPPEEPKSKKPFKKAGKNVSDSRENSAD